MAGGQRHSGVAPQDRTPELSFDDIDQVLRQGDRESGPSDIPAARVREAGMTGGETGRGDVTADDAAPETLIDEDGADAPVLRQPDARAADTALHRVPPELIGGGTGKDEAELARLGRGALEYAASLSWDRAAERHLTVVLRQAQLRPPRQRT